METILLYLIKATVCLVAFALFFRLLLMRETFFRFMRITLLSGMLICSVLPLVKLKIGKSNPFSEQIVLLNEKILTAQIQPNHNIPIVSAAEIGGFSNVPTSETEIEPTNQTAKPFPWLSVLSAIYLAGFAAMIARFALSFIRLRQLISKSRVTQYGKYRLVISEEEVVPFSFFRYIVLSEKDYTENPDEIILHEKMHIRKGHNIDVILSEILLAVHWFNPFVWLMCRDLREIHEYEADSAVIDAGIEAQKYQLLLVKKAVGERRFTSVVNSFNQSKIKNRITMMLRKKSSPLARFKLLFVAPLAAVALLAFAQPRNMNDDYAADYQYRKDAVNFLLSVKKKQNCLACIYVNTQNQVFVMSGDDNVASIKSTDLKRLSEMTESVSKLITQALSGDDPKSLRFVLGAESETQMKNVSEVKNMLQKAYDESLGKLPKENTADKPLLEIEYSSAQPPQSESLVMQVQNNPFFYWEQLQQFCVEKGIKPKDLPFQLSEKNRNVLVVLINSENAVMYQGFDTKWAKTREEAESETAVQTLKDMIVKLMEQNKDKPVYITLQHDVVSSTDFVISFINSILPSAYEGALKEVSDRQNVAFNQLKQTKPLLLLYALPRSFSNKNKKENRGDFQIRLSTQKGNMEEIAVLNGFRIKHSNDTETVSLKFEPIEVDNEKLKLRNITIKKSGFKDPVDRALVVLDEKMKQSDADGIREMLSNKSRTLDAKELYFVFGLKW